MNPIQSLGSGVAQVPLRAPVEAPAVTGGPSFKDALLHSLSDVNAMQQAADRAVEQLSTGGDVNPAEVLTAVQKADLAFKMMMQIRNKIVQAYQDVQNIKV